MAAYLPLNIKFKTINVCSVKFNNIKIDMNMISP